MCEYAQTYDYCDGSLLVIDYFEANLEDIIKNLNIVEVRNVLSIVTVRI